MALQAVEKPPVEFRVPRPEDFRDADTGAEVDYLRDPNLAHLGSRLIDEFSAQFSHCANLRIVYLWKQKGGTRKGKSTFGACQKASGLTGFFGETDFVIWLAADHCELFTFEQFRALLFHELCHIGYDPEDGKIFLQGHDFEGFGAEVRQFGLWHSDLALAGETFAQQLGLFEEKASK